MDDGGNTRDDLKNPDGELGDEIKGAISDGKDILCTVLYACGEESVISTKINNAFDK